MGGNEAREHGKQYADEEHQHEVPPFGRHKSLYADEQRKDGVTYCGEHQTENDADYARERADDRRLRREHAGDVLLARAETAEHAYLLAAFQHRGVDDDCDHYRGDDERNRREADEDIRHGVRHFLDESHYHTEGVGILNFVARLLRIASDEGFHAFLGIERATENADCGGIGFVGDAQHTLRGNILVFRRSGSSHEQIQILTIPGIGVRLCTEIDQSKPGFGKQLSATFKYGLHGFMIFAGKTQEVIYISYQAQLFWMALRNTIVIVFLTVIPSVLIALLIAVALNSIKPLQKLFQTIFFLPYLTNTLAIAAVFQIMFQSAGGAASVQGIINNVIEFFGGTQVDWLNGSNYWASVAVVVIYSIWNGLAFKILILMGALQSVNKQCYEAAKIDGTPKRRVLTKITVPLISPMIAYLLVTGFIGAFKEYTAVLGLFSSPGSTAMGNNNFMITIVGYIYQYIDGSYAGEYGIASAASLILLVIIMIFTAINMYVSKKKVHY